MPNFGERFSGPRYPCTTVQGKDRLAEAEMDPSLKAKHWAPECRTFSRARGRWIQLPAIKSDVTTSPRDSRTSTVRMQCRYAKGTLHQKGFERPHSSGRRRWNYFIGAPLQQLCAVHRRSSRDAPVAPLWSSFPLTRPHPTSFNKHPPFGLPSGSSAKGIVWVRLGVGNGCCSAVAVLSPRRRLPGCLCSLAEAPNLDDQHGCTEKPCSWGCEDWRKPVAASRSGVKTLVSTLLLVAFSAPTLAPPLGKWVLFRRGKLARGSVFSACGQDRLAAAKTVAGLSLFIGSGIQSRWPARLHWKTLQLSFLVRTDIYLKM